MLMMLTIFAKSSTVDVRLGPKYASDDYVLNRFVILFLDSCKARQSSVLCRSSINI